MLKAASFAWSCEEVIVPTSGPRSFCISAQLPLLRVHHNVLYDAWRGDVEERKELAKRLSEAGFPYVPPLFERSGMAAIQRAVEFFVVCIRNRNTREAYARDVARFAAWCESCNVRTLQTVTPMVVAGFIESLGKTHSKQTVKRHLAAIRKLMDWLVTGHIVEVNPAWSVQGPKHVVKKGSTPVLSADEARMLLDSIPRDTLSGLRDRAAISVMLYSFARVSAMCQMERRDFFKDRGQTCFRLHEKGGKRHVVKAHGAAQEAVEEYLKQARLGGNPKSPLFQTLDPGGHPTGKAMTRNDAYRMVARRARAAGLPPGICCHSFRATGLTEFMRNGGNIETAAAIAAHSSTRTTQLYVRLDDDVALSEIERIRV